MAVLFCLFFLITMKANAQQTALTDTGSHIAAVDTALVRVPLRYKNRNRRSPLLALGLDMIFPAVGQIYNKQYLKAGIIYSVVLASGIGLLANNFQPEPYDNNNKPLILQYKPANKTTNTILEGVLLADLFYSLVDAPVSAMRINKKYHLGKRTRSFAALQVSPNIISTGDRRVAGFSVILR
jgi:hypothetical protein